MEMQGRQLTPEQDALEHIAACRDKPFLEERYIDSFKGRGVFTHKAIEPFTFVVEYRGNILSHKDTTPHKKHGDTLTSYLFEFSWEGAHWCIDASAEDRTLGRLVNDDHTSPNCEIKKIVFEGKPHLCLFAVKEISPGEEITYNYGDSHYPWRSALQDSFDGSASFADYYAASTPGNEMLEDSEAGSNSENSYSDDDSKLSHSGPNQDTDSFANTNSQLDLMDSSSVTDLEMTGTFMLQPDDSSFTQHEDEAAFSPAEFGWKGDYRPSRKARKRRGRCSPSKSYCYVCGASVYKMHRHLLRHVDEEPDIAAAFALPKNSKERKKMLTDLRNKGNYKHNQEVLRSNSGELKVRQRQLSVAATPKTHVHCLSCKGMFKRKEMWRHVAKCPSRTTSKSATGGKTRVLGEIALADSPFSQKLSCVVWKMLLNMKQDEIAFAVQNDFLLLQLAECLSKKYRNNPNKHDYIRQKLREMGRLLLALHEKSIFSFEDAIKPNNFYKVVEAVKYIAGFNEKRQSYDKPSLALKLGHSLKKIGVIVLSGVNGDEQIRDTKTFMKLCAKEWSELVSQTAVASLSGRKVNNPSTIPFTRDVQLFYRYLETTATSALESLRTQESPQVYNALCRVTLAQASVLSKCAPEVSKMTLKTFQERDDSTQVLSKHFIRINTLSRTGENVAVLLTSELVSAITLLVSKRKACGVHQDNPFLFAKPNSSPTSLYHGGNCIRAFSSLCRAKNPEHLRSVHLHKHIARIFQILNLENDELDHLAKLLGHDIRTDRDYYRLPEAAVDLAKIAKLLLAMEKGSLERFKGNSLEEIEIEDELEPDVEQDKPENGDCEEDDEESDDVEQQAAMEKPGRQLTPEQDALEHIKARRDKPFLEEMFIDPVKGSGLFTHKSIEPSAFVVEYRGKIVPHKETRRNKHGDTLINYVFDFSWNGTNWRIDASNADGSLGRLVNDDHINPNCVMKKIAYEGKPHLCLFAVKEIYRGEEITYNYGDSSYPWRPKESREEPNTSQTDPTAKDQSVEDASELSDPGESCDDEYVPDSETSSDESDTGSNNQKCQKSKKIPDPDSSKQQSFMQQPVDASDIQQEGEDDFCSDDFTSGEEPEVPSRGNRNYCFVCGNAQSKISRHLLTHRKENPEIAAICGLPKNSKERSKQIEKLRNRGNFQHNEKVLKTGCGQLKVRKKIPDMSNAATTFALCLYCKVMYTRKEMWRHMQRCSVKKSSKSPRIGGKNKVLTLVAAAETTDPNEISSDVSNVLKTLKKDEIGSAVRNDSHILLLAQYWCRTNKDKTRRNVTIPHRLRLMGRLLVTLKKKSICSFEDATKPENFSKVVEAVKELADFNDETKSCKRPSIMRSLGNCLKNIGDINFARALKEDADKQRLHEVETFMKLCANEWKYIPPSKLVQSLPTIPFTQDVQLLYQCIEKTAASAVESLTKYESPPVYNALLRATVAQVSVFNKNVAEVSNVTFKSFIERDETELHDDAAAGESQFEQLLSKNSVKINVLSNKGKKVTVRLTPKQLTAITLLVSKREACGVHQKNPFLFGRPSTLWTNFYRGLLCVRTFAARCGAKNEMLKCEFFRKHVTRIFQILSLTNDGLDQLGKLLGRDIRTDSEYYQTPEAVVDIAKISQLLSAMENGSLATFEGKSLEEIEVADELVPDVEEENPENSDVEEDFEGSEMSFQLSDVTNGADVAQDEATTSKGFSFSKGSSSATAKKKSRVSSGRGRRRRQESENEAFGLNDETNDEVVNAEKDHRSEETPVSCAVNTPEETPSRSNEDAANIYFSDDDEDMNVDFDMDFDTDEDIGRNEESDGGGDRNASAADVKDATEKDNDSSDTEENDSSPNKLNTAAEHEEDMDTDTENHVDEEDREEGGDEEMDVDSRSSSPILNTEKKCRLFAALAGMKDVKILIPKLDIENLQTPVRVSQLPSVFNPPVEDQPKHADEEQRPKSSSTSTDKNKPSNAKEIQMTCSHCKKIMMKGQTAYQKKGFTDVFCSKDCLFEMFPTMRPVTKTCHYCLKAITQPLDLIMAAVDVKGTMKDFCSTTCLCFFKNNIVLTSVCSMCNKSCTAPCELTLKDTVLKFCNNSCMEDFRRDKMVACGTCNSLSHKPLVLKLENEEEEEEEEETKNFCSEDCLQDFKENIKTPHQCGMCHTSRPLSDMVHHTSDENTVELFCTRPCITSYRLRPAIVYKLQGKKTSKKKKRGKQSKEILNTEDAQITSDSTGNTNDASPAAEPDMTATLFISDSWVVCCLCGKGLPRGQTIYQPKSSLEVFCSASCLCERHPHVTFITKTCYHCSQVIMRPHNIILAPVDDSGTMKELCSDACLDSVNSKRNMAVPKPPPPVGPRSECRMCSKFCVYKFKLKLEGSMHRLCSDACFINYHKVNNLPVFTCDICASFCLDQRFTLKMEDCNKNICSEKCLVKFKKRIQTPQLCPMCQTSHQLSDMVENKNDEGRLDFFCSNRCMMVHKAQAITVSGRNSPSSDENDVKEVKPLLNLDCNQLQKIKEEPVDEDYSQNPPSPSSISTEDIKDEPNVAKEDLKIGSVFSLKGDSTSTAPTFTHMDLPASCSQCKKVLMDGETVYQRKGHADIFCCSSCLLKFYQMKQVKKTCHFCLQALTQSQDVLQAPVDNEGTMKDFCSHACLSSFNYKRIMSSKIPIVPLASHSQCNMCNRYCISKHEIIRDDAVHKICSDPCFRRFCNMNNLTICDNCHSHCGSPLILKIEDCSKKLCSAECTAQFKQTNKTQQLCAMCSTSHLMSDMVENRNSDDVVELFCSSSCVMASKIQAVSASGAPLNCDNCCKTTVPACHLAMSDASIRNFCTLSCAMAFKETHKDTKAETNQAGASDQTQSDFLKPPEKLPCAQCRRILKSTPKVIQKKGKMNFVCSLACSQEFKRVNNILGKCEYCENERIIRDVKRVDDKDCYFCSDGCKMLFRHELEKKWGEHCHSCAYCLSISKTVVTARYDGADEEFCSEVCNSNYNMLFCNVAKCDTCGREGKLRQSLPMVGEVKHFCDLKCLLHFCNKKVQMANTVSSPPRSAGTAESSPVITNVISLAGALSRQSNASAQRVSFPDIQTKVVGHASVQTVSKEVKNKSTLCTPLVHNKGVSCTTPTVDTEAQTDKLVPKVIVLPVPVPVYVPLPMSMYSQCTPQPVGLPLPLPVPVFLPVTPDSPDPTVKSTKETIKPDSSVEDVDLKSEMKKDEKRNETEDRVETKDGQREEIQAPKENSTNCSDDLEEGSLSDTSFESPTRPHEHEKPPPVLEEVMPDQPQPDLPPPPPPPPAPPALEMREDPQSPVSPPPQSQRAVGKVHNKNKSRKLQHLSKAAKEETYQRSKLTSRKHHKRRSRCGIDAWKRWIQWRESQTNLDLVSSRAATLNEDVLRCSAAELSDGLCCFITEVKQPDGEPYSPDGLFYLCLGIQQYLFENGRMENIFSDRTYNKFSTEFTKILKGFKPSVTATGYIHSRVEEEFLWDCKQLGAYSPIVILNTLLFFCCKYFGFTTVEQHRQLSFARVMRCTKTKANNTKATFLRFSPPISINEAEPDADGVPAKRRKKHENILEMMENAENSLRCPVRFYKFYLSKCSESVHQRDDLFYLQPDRCCVPSSPLWFSSTSLDDSTMETMLVRILAVRGLRGEDGGGVDRPTSGDASVLPDEEDSE